MNLFKSFFALIVMLLANTSYSADGSSGCGPGWYILTENSLVSSSLRSTTNGMLAPVATIGMTFGTSKCTKHKIVLKEKESLYFVEQNYYELKTQAAQGGGAYVTALAQTMGCATGAEVPLSQELQKSYNTVFPATPSPQPDSSLIEVYKIILQSPVLSQKCNSSVLS
ncbi:MAG: DUF3015 family protein [Bdellovibrionales bacterium]